MHQGMECLSPWHVPDPRGVVLAAGDETCSGWSDAEAAHRPVVRDKMGNDAGVGGGGHRKSLSHGTSEFGSLANSATSYASVGKTFPKIRNPGDLAEAAAWSLVTARLAAAIATAGRHA